MFRYGIKRIIVSIFRNECCHGSGFVSDVDSWVGNNGCCVTQGATEHITPDTWFLCDVNHVDHGANSVNGCGSNGRLFAATIKVGNVQLTICSLFIYHVHRDHTFDVTIDIATTKHIGMLTTIKVKSDITAVTYWENRILVMERLCHFANVSRIGKRTT